MPQDTVSVSRDDETTRLRARAALDRQDALRTPGIIRAPRKAKADKPKTTNASQPSTKPMGLMFRD